VQLRPMQKSKRIRVLQLGSPTGLYGAERWILALLKHLDKTRIDPIVGVIRDDSLMDVPLCEEAERIGIRTHIIDAQGKFSLSAVKQLRQYIKENRIDILHSHFYKADAIGLWATRGTRCKTISTPHGWSTKAGIKLFCYENLDRVILGFLDAVVPLSEDIYRNLKMLPRLARKLYLIRNGVDIGEIDGVDSVSEEMKLWKSLGNSIIGYIGQLIPRKNVDVLIRAFATLKLPKAKLALVGEGPLRSELEKLAGALGVGDKVHFFGFRRDRISILKGFDVFVLPSRLEGIPRCLMEAMAAGVPVVASDIPGCRDIVSDSDTGLLFKSEKEESLRLCLISLIDNRRLRDRLKSRARETIENRWSASRMAKEYRALYECLSHRDI
jgi:glycosyltransferase involved in cell wall biosynthesis